MIFSSSQFMPRFFGALGAVLFAAGVLAMSGPASAKDTKEVCRKYAERAARHDATNRELNCGYGGQRWNSSARHHLDWCLEIRGNARMLKEQNQERRNQLDKCRRKGGTGGSAAAGGGNCGAYADRAVRQYNNARKNKCGFGGDRWSGVRGDHIRWCRSVNAKPRLLKEQTQERRLQIEDCKKVKR